MKLAIIFPEKLPLKKARAISVINTAAALSKLVPTTLITSQTLCSKKELEQFYDVDLSSLNLLFLKDSLFFIKSSKIFNYYLKQYIKHFDTFYVRHLKVANFLINHRTSKQKVIFEAHEVFYKSLKEEKPWESKKIEKLKKLEKKVYSTVDGIVFTSKTLRKFFIKTFSLKNTKTVIIPHAVKFIPPFIKKDFSKLNELFYCGSFYRWKGVEVAISALRDIPNMILILVGSCNEKRKAELVKFAESLGIKDKVVFLGYKSQKETYDLLINRAKITIIPNTKSIQNWFSFPLKLLEYMSTSNIVIASDTPVIKEILKEEYNGFLFETGSADALAKKVKKVINLPSEVLQRISKNAYETARSFTYEKRAQKILDFLKSL